MEGAMLAAACLWYNGKKPLLLDIKTTNEDDEHVVALFKNPPACGGLWGAISKTNHAVLRYRDPIYKTMRELALSYFNEYFLLKNGKKTMRSYSAPFSLLKYGNDWLVSEKNLWHIPKDLDNSRHFKLFPNRMAGRLRIADPIEIKAGSLTDWKRTKKKV